MNIQDWNIDKDKTSINSNSTVVISWLNVSLQTWFEIEDNQSWWSENQINAFKNFLNLNTFSKKELKRKLEENYAQEIGNNKIKTSNFDNILDTINWEKSNICVPQHYSSSNQYILLLLDTQWNLTESDFTLEIELLYTNNSIELIQEMSGLWNRMEWFEYYLKRKNI